MEEFFSTILFEIMEVARIVGKILTCMLEYVHDGKIWLIFLVLEVSELGFGLESCLEKLI